MDIKIICGTLDFKVETGSLTCRGGVTMMRIAGMEISMCFKKQLASKLRCVLLNSFSLTLLKMVRDPAEEDHVNLAAF